MRNKHKKNNTLFLSTTHHSLRIGEGFSLIELLLAMAIIAILSGAVLVSIGSQRKKANQSKMLMELSATIQPMLMCRTDGGIINEPNGATGGGNICASSANYGKWPLTTSNTFGNYVSDTAFEDGGWFFYIDDGTRRICCNSSSAKCHDLASATACTNVVPAN